MPGKEAGMFSIGAAMAEGVEFTNNRTEGGVWTTRIKGPKNDLVIVESS